MAGTADPLIVIQMIGPEGCGKSTLARLLYLYFLDHPFEYQLREKGLGPPERSHPPHSVTPTSLHWHPNVPRWLTPSENPHGYAAAVQAALSRKCNAAGEPPVTHLILDSTHLSSSDRNASFYPPKDGLHSAAVWLYCYFTHPTCNMAVQAERCRYRNMLPSHPPSVDPMSVAPIPWSSAFPVHVPPVEAKGFCDVLEETNSSFLFSTLPGDSLSSVEEKIGRKTAEEGACTVGVVKVSTLASVSERCQGVLRGLDQLLQQWRKISSTSLSLRHLEESTSHPKCSLDAHDISPCPSLPCSWRPYFSRYPLSLSSIGQEMKKYLCSEQEKNEGGSAHEGATDFSFSPTEKRSASASRRECIAMAYNHYRRTILGLPWTKSLLYASVSLLSDDERSCGSTLGPSHPSLPFFPSKYPLKTKKNKKEKKRETKCDGTCDTDEGGNTARPASHPFFSLLRWVPSAFLQGKTIVSEFHVTLRFLANGVDPVCIVALGEEVRKQDKTNQESKRSASKEEKERGKGVSREEQPPQQGQERKENDVKDRQTSEKKRLSPTTPPCLLERCIRPSYRCFYDVVVRAVVSDPKATAMLIDPSAAPAFPPCSNCFPHITIATAPGIPPSYSNVLLYEALERKRSPVSIDKYGTFERFIFWCDRQELEKIVIPPFHEEEETTKAVAKPTDDKQTVAYEGVRGSGHEGPKETERRRQIKEVQREVEWKQKNSAASESGSEEMDSTGSQGTKDREGSLCNGGGAYCHSSHPQGHQKEKLAEEEKKIHEESTHPYASGSSPLPLPTFCGVLCIHTCSTEIQHKYAAKKKKRMKSYR